MYNKYITACIIAFHALRTKLSAVGIFLTDYVSYYIFHVNI